MKSISQADLQIEEQPVLKIEMQLNLSSKAVVWRSIKHNRHEDRVYETKLYINAVMSREISTKIVHLECYENTCCASEKFVTTLGQDCLPKH